MFPKMSCSDGQNMSTPVEFPLLHKDLHRHIHHTSTTVQACPMPDMGIPQPSTGISDSGRCSAG